MYLYGASGHAKVILDSVRSESISIKGIYDDNEEKKTFFDIPFLGKYENRIQALDGPILISIGDNKIRKKISEKIQGDFFTTKHKTAVISSRTVIGEGTAIMVNALINGATTIGKHAIVNTGAIIEHDCKIEDFVHISPGSIITGGVIVGEGSHIGAGAVVIPNKTIGKWCIIGAGAIIINDIPDYAVVVGNPGKIIKYNNPN